MKKCLGVIKLLVEKRSIELPSLHLSETMFHAQMGEELTSDKRKKNATWTEHFRKFR